MPDASTPPRLTARAGATLVALTLLAYLPAWPGGFLIEDWSLLQQHRQWSLGQTVAFELGFPLRDRAWVEEHRPDFFTNGSWRPWAWIALHAEQRVFDDWTGGYYLSRIVMTILAAWLLATATMAWTSHAHFAWLTALFFALHPSRFVGFGVVSNITFPLGALGLFAALWGLARWRGGRAGTGTLAIGAGSALACGSYEQALPLLVVLPVLDLCYPLRTGRRPRVRDVAGRTAVIASVVAVYMGLRIIRMEGLGGYQSMTGASAFDLTQPLTLLWGTVVATGAALQSLALPVPLTRNTLPGSGVALGAGVSVAINGCILLGLVWRCAILLRGRAQRVSLGAAGVLLLLAWTLLPVAGLLHGHDPWSRYVYFPGILWAGVLAWVCVPRAREGRVGFPAVVAIAMALALVWRTGAVWGPAWRQARALHEALAPLDQPPRMSYVYLRGFDEWVNERNLFIRSLAGPIDVGRDPHRLRVWPSAWTGPSPIPVPTHATWPYAEPPLVRMGTWDAGRLTLDVVAAPTYVPGTTGDVRMWDLTTQRGLAPWHPGALLDRVPGAGPGLHLRVASPFAVLQGPELTRAWTPAVLGLEMTASAATPQDWLEVLFYTPHQRTAAASHVLRVRVTADGQPRRYIMSLLDHPVPATAGPVTRLGLRLSRHAGTRVHIRAIWIAAAGAGPPDTWTQAPPAEGAW